MAWHLEIDKQWMAQRHEQRLRAQLCTLSLMASHQAAMPPGRLWDMQAATETLTGGWAGAVAPQPRAERAAAEAWLGIWKQTNSGWDRDPSARCCALFRGWQPTTLPCHQADSGICRQQLKHSRGERGGWRGHFHDPGRRGRRRGGLASGNRQTVDGTETRATPQRTVVHSFVDGIPPGCHAIRPTLGYAGSN